jgi:hypothetical protein
MVVFGCAGDDKSFVRTDERGEIESMYIERGEGHGIYKTRN